MTVALLALTLLIAAFAAPLPSIKRKCGAVELSETVLDGRRIDDYQIYYMDNTQIVFLRVLGLKGSYLYKSTDEGLTWELQSTEEKMRGVGEDGVSRIFHAMASDGTITLYFLGSYGDGKMWTSRDKGVTYELLSNVPKGIYYMYMHDMFPGTALARAGVFGSDISSQKHDVYYVSDFGRKWQKIAEVPNLSHIEWSRISTVSPDRIYLQNYTTSSSMKRWDSRLIYSDDFFKTYHTLTPENVLTWQIVPPNRLVVTTCKDKDACKFKQLWISEDGGTTFNLATFPDRDHEIQDETDVFVWEVSDDTMWVNVERDCPRNTDYCDGDLFHSYSADKEFTLALEDHRRWDFTKYESMDGIYLANQYFVPGSNDVRSLITFNKGGSWDLIKAPALNARGQPTNCAQKDGCGLHLHGWADRDFDYFYSVPNAVGVMLASGNIGPRLENKRADVNLYYSRNGGLEWQEVRTGHWIMEIGDHGSIIVAAEMDTPVNEIIYTVTDGDEWHTCNLGTIPVTVSNIRVDVGWDSRQFILYGTRIIGGNSQVVVIHLNFEKVYTRKCVEGSDYENWTPASEHGSCFMGERSTYSLRKFGTPCYYGQDHKIKESSTRCPCTKEDYECAYCFYRPAMGEDCKRECGPQAPPTAEQCPKRTGQYSVDEGWVLIDGNKCDSKNPLAAKPKGKVACSYIPTDGRPTSDLNGVKKAFLYIFIAGALWVALGALVIMAWKKNTAFREFVANTLGIANPTYVQGGTLQSSDDEAITPASDGVINSDDLSGLESSSASEGDK